MDNNSSIVDITILQHALVKKSICLQCKKKKPIVIAACYDHKKNDLGVGTYCKECFRRIIPDYTLENDCLVCESNFKCDIQKILFSKEEIKNFKSLFWDKNEN